MDYLKYGWSVVKKDWMAWIILYVVMSIAAQFFVGLLLMPQAFRVIRKSMNDGTAPAIGDYFNFDRISDDAITMVILSVVYFAAAMLCYLPIFAAIPLMVWVIHLAAENRYAPMDNIKASFAHAKENFGEIFMTLLVIWVVASILITVTCGIGALVVFPTLMVALEKFYQDNRNAIFAAADAAGVPARA